MMKAIGTALLLGASVMSFAALGGCIAHSVTSAPIEIKPIYITMDINLRVQRELEEFFDFEAPAASAARPSTPEGKE
jgi:hypothetical protein